MFLLAGKFGVRIIKPTCSVNFTHVATTIDDQWFASVYPKGRNSGLEYFARYGLPEKASQ